MSDRRSFLARVTGALAGLIAGKTVVAQTPLDREIDARFTVLEHSGEPSSPAYAEYSFDGRRWHRVATIAHAHTAGQFIGAEWREHDGYFVRAAQFNPVAGIATYWIALCRDGHVSAWMTERHPYAELRDPRFEPWPTLMRTFV